MRSLGTRAGAVQQAAEQVRDARLTDRMALAAFISYLAISIFFFGRGICSNPSSAYIGRGPDAQQYIWFVAWWAHAISHRLNPFFTSIVWAPSGVNLAWATDFPLAGVLLYPLTRLWGPIVACNVLRLVAPALAGWSAFALCRYVVHRFWPAWLGGWVFAFSPAMLTGMVGSIFLLLVFPLPLMVWAALRRMAGEISGRRSVTILAALLVAEFLMSPELFATAALFGAIAIALAARSALAPSVRLRSTAWSILVAYAISGIVLLPYLYGMFAFGAPAGGIFSPWRFSIDLVNFVIPTHTNQLGMLAWCGAVARRFSAELSESGGYLCLPLIAIAVLFARERWSERAGKFLVVMLAIVCVCAMGPVLQFAGDRLMPLPAAALVFVPLLNKALPSRFMIYAFLVLSLMVAMWLGASPSQADDTRRAWRWTLGLAIIPFMLPNLSTSLWASPGRIPAFFNDGLYRKYLAPGDTVMVLPFGLFGEGMLWQATAGMYFSMAGGYIGLAPPLPPEDSGWPIMAGLYGLAGVPDATAQFKAYLASHHVSAVIVGPRTQYLMFRLDGEHTAATWLKWPTQVPERLAAQKLLASLGTPLAVGGIDLYRVAPATLAPFRDLSALAMQRRAVHARFDALLVGAERYFAQGRSPEALTPQALESLGLAPEDWFGGKPFPDHDHSGNPLFHLESMLRASGSTISVGLEGGYGALAPLFDRYGAQASAIYFPYPARLTNRAADANQAPAMMVMEFDRQGLARAAAAASASTSAVTLAGPGMRSIASDAPVRSDGGRTRGR